jgi:hypothetical protein
MKTTLKNLIFILLLSLIAACNLGRGFKPPPNANEGWTSKQNPSQAEINKAMIDCGVVELSNGAGLDNSENERAVRTECMFRKQFYMKSGWGGPCATPEFRARIPACANAPIRSRNSYYGN